MESDVFAVVPSYNHAPFIERCVRSILGQSLHPKKLLVIDDGSTDGSPAIIERVLKDCPYEAELIVRENRGLCATLNQALEMSGEKYFAYLGCDDIWLPRFLERRREMLESRKNAVLAYGHAYLIDENDNVTDSTAEHTATWAHYPDGYARPMLVKGHSPISSTVFYRQSALEAVRWNEGARLEDYEMYIRLMDLGDFAFDPEILSAWRDHSSNTSKNSEMMLDEIIETQKRNFDILGATREELKEMQLRTKFTYARERLQYGDKAGAIRMARSSWRGADSLPQLLKFIIRLAVPMSVVEMKRSRKEKRPLESVVN